MLVPKDFGAICLYALYDIETQRRPNNSRWVQCVVKTKIISCFQRFFISFDVRIFGYFSNWIHLLAHRTVGGGLKAMWHTDVVAPMVMNRFP